jgi:DNA-binding NtrC family response regulator
MVAMNEVLRVLLAGGREEEALERSFEQASRGFAAEKALLLLVESQEPLRLRRLLVYGLTEPQVRACESGASLKGVSSSVIRGAIQTRRVGLIPNPLGGADPHVTPALVGDRFSVLCAPIIDPVRDIAMAVMYFQTCSDSDCAAYGAPDASWLEGYASALSRAFGLHFQEQRHERELEALLQRAERPDNAPELVGDSAHTQALRRMLHEVFIPAAEAPEPEPLLLLGEKGTGKDLIARYLHAYSARRGQPLLALNCAEITDELAAARFFGHKKGAFTGAVSDEQGLFRVAHRGVLFLDEIAELSPRAQATLLRVLENRTVVPVGETHEQRVDVQVVLATNRELGRAIEAGVLREDFLDRFKTQLIQLAPLRDRPWDIPTLLRHFLAYHERRTRKKTLGFGTDAMRALVSYAWPGNVRELARLCSLLVTYAVPGAPIDRALLQKIYPDLLRGSRNPKAAPVLWADVPMREAVRLFERELIMARLEQHKWNARAAGASLRIPKTTLRRHMTRLGIERPRFG